MPATGVDWSTVVARIKDSVDIVDIISEYVPLRKRGNNFIGLCPFHQEKTGSFSVNQDKQFFHCFGCGVSGDVIEFIKKREGIDFKDALAKLAYRAGIVLPEPKASFIGIIAKINAEATEFFRKSLKRNDAALIYLKKRGLDEKSIDEFEIGYATDIWNDLTQILLKKYSREALVKSGISVLGQGKLYDRFRSRIMIPIRNGKMIVGFGGRAMEDGNFAKYLNTSKTEAFNKGRILFGFDKAKSAISKAGFAVVCEGYFDMIALYESGISNSVATLGTALTEFHIGKIKRITNKIYFCYDTDKAGIAAMTKLIPLLIKNEIIGRIVKLTPGDDPDSFVRRYGKDAFLKKIAQAEDAFDFWIKSQSGKASTISERSMIWKKIVPVIDNIDDIAIREMFLDRAGQLIGVPYSKTYCVKKDLEEKRDITKFDRAGKIILKLILSDRSLLDKIDSGIISFFPPRINRIVDILMKNRESGLSDIISALGKDDSDAFYKIITEPEIAIEKEKKEALFRECITYYKIMKKKKERTALIKQIKSASDQGRRVDDLLRKQQSIIKDT